MSEAINPAVKYVSDVEAFGEITSQLGNLSRYADNAATAAYSGKVKAEELDAFVSTVRSYYETLKFGILSIVDEDHRDQVAVSLRDLPQEADIFTAALVLDQAIAWLTAHMLPGNFAHNLRMSEMQRTIQEKMTNRELVNLKQPSEHGGLYA
jgi:hypothetical protein